MSNPFYGILINGVYYNIVSDSYSQGVKLRNSTLDAQTNRTNTVLGSALPVHTMTLQLDSYYAPVDPITNNVLGYTFYTGSSRKAELISMIGALGASMPLTMVIQDGTTHLVLPTGMADFRYFNPNALGASGVEWRVTLTLENVS